MTKLFTSLRVATLAAISVGTLAGCEMYFGEESESWDYCGADGYYSCEGDNCTWVSSTCPDGTQTGLPCADDNECAAGCYCDEAAGVCVEGGFCTQDSDCGEGLECDEERSSCEEPETPTCDGNEDCAAGSTCQDGHCVATCVCESDQEAQQNGFDFCDEARETCMTGVDPAGSCAGEITCNTNPPVCPEGEVPSSLDGCWTGSCRAIAQCDVTPDCNRLQQENECLARATTVPEQPPPDCSAVYTGINCTKPDGSACQAGDSGCTCADFRFNSCTTRTSAKPDKSGKVVTSYDGYLTFESMFH
jgi:hypothetical protein